jgi:hypothetical protein
MIIRHLKLNIPIPKLKIEWRGNIKCQVLLDTLLSSIAVALSKAQMMFYLLNLLSITAS